MSARPLLTYHNGIVTSRPVYCSYSSPLGTLFLASGPDGLTHLLIGGTEADFLSEVSSVKDAAPLLDGRPFSSLFRSLEDYFKGRPVIFTVPLTPSGSGFDKAVWKALSSIPWGSKMSYAEVAALVGKSGAARAVGGACGRNPIPIIIPCHRVLQANGSIGGYSGGAGIKEKLLALEGVPFKAGLK